MGLARSVSNQLILSLFPNDLMCWLSVALRHQKLASPPVVPQMNSLLMRQPVCFVQYPHKYWSRPTASLSLCVCVCVHTQLWTVRLKQLTGAPNQKIEMSFCGVMFLSALWFTASCKGCSEGEKVLLNLWTNTAAEGTKSCYDMVNLAVWSSDFPLSVKWIPARDRVWCVCLSLSSAIACWFMPCCFI